MKKFALTLAILCLSCNSQTLKVYSTLGDLRFLAIVAANGTAAEASPGDTFTVTPYISDLNSTGTISFSVTGCVDPGISYGATPTCTGSATAQSYTLASVTAPYTDFTGSFSVTIPSSILTGQSAQTQYNGYSYLLFITATNSNGLQVTGFKRILVSTKSSKNQNPTLIAILNSGSTLSTLSAGATATLSYQAASGSAESYSVENSDGSFYSTTETLQATWFGSDGTFTYTRTNDGGTSTYTAPSSYPTTRSSFIICVLRDGRGGEAVLKTVIH
jgi:hypothetical protein